MIIWCTTKTIKGPEGRINDKVRQRVLSLSGLLCIYSLLGVSPSSVISRQQAYYFYMRRDTETWIVCTLYFKVA